MSVRSHALMPALESGHLRMPSWSAMGAALAHVVLWPLRIAVRFQASVIERETIARMDDRMLRDVGLTRADAWAEVEKPFWRLDGLSRDLRATTCPSSCAAPDRFNSRREGFVMLRRLLAIVSNALASAMAPLTSLGAGMRPCLRRLGRSPTRWGRRAPEHDSVTVGADLR